MLLHLMLAGPDRGSLKGLCGATVKHLYLRRVPTDERRSAHGHVRSASRSRRSGAAANTTDEGASSMAAAAS